MANHTDSDAPAEPGAPGVTTVEEETTAVVRGSVPPAGLRDFFDTSFHLLPQVIAGQGAAIRGPAFCLYRTAPGAQDPAAALHLEVGFIVDRVVVPQNGVTLGHLPAGDVARYVHAGGYDGLDSAWQRLHAWIADHGGRPGIVRWEIYRTRPTPDMDPADLRTELNWLLVPADER